MQYRIGKGSRYKSLDQLAGIVKPSDQVFLTPGEKSPMTRTFDWQNNLRLGTFEDGEPHILQLITNNRNAQAIYVAKQDVGGVISRVRFEVPPYASNYPISYSGRGLTIEHVFSNGLMAFFSQCGKLTAKDWWATHCVDFDTVYAGGVPASRWATPLWSQDVEIDGLHASCGEVPTDPELGGQHTARLHWCKNWTLRNTELTHTSRYGGSLFTFKESLGLKLINFSAKCGVDSNGRLSGGGGFGPLALPGSDPASRHGGTYAENFNVELKDFLNIGPGVYDLVIKGGSIKAPMGISAAAPVLMHDDVGREVWMPAPTGIHLEDLVIDATAEGGNRFIKGDTTGWTWTKIRLKNGRKIADKIR